MYLIQIDTFSSNYISLTTPEQIKAQADGTPIPGQKPFTTTTTDYGTVFQQELDAIIAMEEIRPHVPLNQSLKLVKVKEVCEIYYFIEMSYNKEQITIGKTWSYKNKGTPFLLSRQYYTLNQFDEFVTKLKELKLEVINVYHNKILAIHALNPYNL